MKIRKVFRSAITGLFVTKKEAEANPETTVQETVYDYGINEVLDTYAKDLDFEDWQDLQAESSKNEMTNHFKKILKTLRK